MQRITQLQLVLMVILFHFSTATGFMISPLASMGSYQGWVVLLVAAVGGLLVTGISVFLARQKPNEFIAHYGKQLIGRFPHVAIMIAVVFYFVHVAALVLRQITDFLVQVYLPTTPQWVVAGLFGLTVSIAVRSGIEAIFRCASGFFFVIMCTSSLAPFAVGQELEFDRAIAFITHMDPVKLWSASYPFVPWFGEMFLILFIFPYIAEPEKTFRSLFWSTMAGVGFIGLNYIMCILMFGPHMTENLTYPVLEMIRFMRIGDFLQNLDPFLVAIWMASVFVKTSLLLYTPVLIVSQLFGLKDARPLSFSFGAIMLGFAISMAKNYVDLQYFILYTWPTFALVMESSPLIYLAAAFIRKRKFLPAGMFTKS
ncbi:GerAB/ArcD/ProY family transporter [Paenibacillus hamazuiensis]|uniref:GerAB/ArcD/ProY family transporter n=1 Tax=Paenibacillus hamazuiensis TaxID=2936508 RepID=UPI00201030F8|nr:GerAB/ArcD/ProY family transporter [Paenibacillus hamazuiensis]